MRWLNRHWPRLNAQAGFACRVLRLYAANGSARAWGRLLRHVGRRRSATPPPAFFAIGLTYRCVCRCEHCYAAGRTRDIADELRTDEVRELLDQAAELGALEVFFTGAEPLLRRDVPELIAHARGLGLLTRISTNGYLLDDKRVEALAAAGLTQAGVSLDSADPEEHDRSRNLPGLHARALQGIRRLLDAGIRAQVHCVTFRRSIPAGVERVIALARNLRASGVCLIFPTAAGRLECVEGEVLTDQERAAVRALQDFAFVFADLPTSDSMCAAAGCAFLYVNPYAYASPCTTVRYTMGNVRRTPVGEIWRRFVDGMDIPSRGRCILNDSAKHAALQDYMATLQAMDPGPPAETASGDSSA